ncbi:MAG: DUF4293 domain-containing protein [Bacteroidales bacterium]|nr:DUF4293 domain-containing protein [Bacteroidales bacterium]
MWQRIQTLYLAISTILIAVMAFGVKATTVGSEGDPVTEYRYFSYVPYAILIVIILLLNILALTTYKFRVFQMRTAVLSSIITLALQIWLVVDFFSNRDAGIIYRISAVFPIVSIILNLFAARGILADEMLVESAYRLRSSRKNRKRR